MAKNPCIDKHASDSVKQRHEAIVKGGKMSDKGAAIKAAMEEHEAIFNELIKFKKSLNIKLTKKETTYVAPNNDIKIKEITDSYSKKIEEAQKSKNKPQKSDEAQLEEDVQSFGVTKKQSTPVATLITELFNGLKNSGIVAAEKVADWVQIGKAGANETTGEAIQPNNQSLFLESDAVQQLFKGLGVKLGKALGVNAKALFMQTQPPPLPRNTEVANGFEILKKKYGETTATLLRDEMKIALDYPTQFIEYITKKVPVKGDIPYMIKNVNARLKAEFGLKVLNITTGVKESKPKGTPESLAEEALYKFHRPKDIEEIATTFAADFREGELICTIGNYLKSGSDRTKAYFVFWMRKHAVDTILPAYELTEEYLQGNTEGAKQWREYLETKGRKNKDGTFDLKGLLPKKGIKNQGEGREDPYGTSSMSVQILKGDGEMSIKNRYNHIVANPDNTLGSDLDNVIDGLQDAVYAIEGMPSKANQELNLPGNIKSDSNGNLFRFDREINNVPFSQDGYFKDGVITLIDKSTQRMVDDLLIDSRAKTIKFVVGSNDSGIKNISKINISNDKITIQTEDGGLNFILEKGVLIGVNGDITTIGDNFLTSNESIKQIDVSKATTIGDNFLTSNESIEQIDVSKATTIGYNFLTSNENLKTIDVSKATTIGDNFLRNNESIEQIDVSKATTIGYNFLRNNEKLKTIDVREATTIGNDFLYNNKNLKTIDVSKAITIGDNFLYNNESIEQIDVSKATTIGYNFLTSNENLKTIDVSKATTIGDNFLRNNESIEQIDVSKATTIGYNFLRNNEKLKTIDVREATTIGNDFLYNNESIEQIDVSKATTIGNDFLYNNKNLEQIDVSKAITIGKNFLYYNKNIDKKQFGSALLKDKNGETQAQYFVRSGENVIESIKDFDKAKNKNEATVALVHEIMHPTVVAIIDSAKDGNETGLKHANAIVAEFNKANPDNQVTLDELIAGNDAFKGNETSDQYRAVQEFIAVSWEQYHLKGKQGFSKAFQDFLDQITKAFKSVYGTVKGDISAELTQLFNELLSGNGTNLPSLAVMPSNRTNVSNNTPQVTPQSQPPSRTPPPPPTPPTIDDEGSSEIRDADRKKISDRLKDLLAQPKDVTDFVEKFRAKMASSKSAIKGFIGKQFFSGPRSAVIVNEKIESLKGRTLDRSKVLFDKLNKFINKDKTKNELINSILSTGSLNDNLAIHVADNAVALSIVTGDIYTPQEIRDAIRGVARLSTKKQQEIIKALKGITTEDIKEAKQKYSDDVRKLVGEYINKEEFMSYTPVSMGQQGVVLEGQSRTLAEIEDDIKSLPSGDAVLAIIKKSLAEKVAATTELSKTVDGAKALLVANEARSIIDDLSDYIAYSPSMENIPDRVSMAARGGKGYYLKRTFQYWKNKDFTPNEMAREMAQQNIEDTLYVTNINNLLDSKEYKKATPKEKAALMDDFMASIKEQAKVELDKYIDINRMKREGKIPTGNISVSVHKINAKYLKKKGIIDEAFLRLLGSTDNAVGQFFDTVAAQVQIQASADLQYVLNQVYASGDIIYNTHEDVIKAKGTSEGYTKMSDTNGILGGKFVRNDVAAVLKIDITPPSKIAAKYYFKPLAFTRMVATVFNPAGWATNLEGGLFGLVANGVMNPAITAKVTVSAISNIFSPASSMAKKYQALKHRMQRTGVWKTSVSAHAIDVLARNFNDANTLNPNDADGISARKKIMDAIGRGSMLTGDAFKLGYAVIDDFTKMLIFEAKADIFARKIYGKSYDKLATEDERRIVDNAVAERVKQNMPTASRLPEYYNTLVKVPFGDFLGFRISAASAGLNTYKNAFTDIMVGLDVNNGMTGTQRTAYLQDGIGSLIGLILLAYGSKEGWQLLANLLSDDEDDDDGSKKSLKFDFKNNYALLQNWMRGKNVVVISFNKYGDVAVGNVSNKDPYDEIHSLIFGREGSTRIETLGGILRDVTGINMLVTTVLEVLKGKDAFERPIADEDESDLNNFFALTKYAIEKRAIPPSILATWNGAKKDAILKVITKEKTLESYEILSQKEQREAEKKAEDDVSTIDVLKEFGSNSSNLLHRNYKFNIYQQFYYSIKEEYDGKKNKFEDLNNTGREERYSDLKKIHEAYVFLEKFNKAYPDSKNAQDAFFEIGGPAINISNEESRYIRTGEMLFK